MNTFPKVLLASKSPRRHYLMKQMGLPFEVAEIDVEETYPDDIPLHQVAEFLAIKKAQVTAISYPDRFLLTADCVVIDQGEILGKPISREVAIATIQRLQGGRHQVVSGVCLKHGVRQTSFSDTTTVEIAPMTVDEIAWYIDTFAPFDKAGSYGIQDWIGHCKVTRIEGSYNNVMGLPTHLLYSELREFTNV